MLGNVWQSVTGRCAFQLHYFTTVGMMEWTHRRTCWPWLSEFGDADGGQNHAILEAMIQWVGWCIVRPISYYSWGHDPGSSEMYCEAMIVGVWTYSMEAMVVWNQRCTKRPRYSEWGGVHWGNWSGDSRLGGMLVPNTPYTGQYTRNTLTVTWESTSEERINRWLAVVNRYGGISEAEVTLSWQLLIKQMKRDWLWESDTWVYAVHSNNMYSWDGEIQGDNMMVCSRMMVGLQMQRIDRGWQWD